MVHPAQALLNSTPRLPARDRGAVAQGAQLGPGDLRMDAAAQAAVGAGDDVFSADEIRGVADDTRNQDLSSGEFHVAPDFELCAVRSFASY